MKTDSITLNAYAKINLSLEVIRRRKDGYHDILSFMQDLGLSDRVTVGASEEKLQLEIQKCCAMDCFIDDIKVKFCMDNNTIPMGPENLGYKGAAAVLRALDPGMNRPESICIIIEKHLPVAAGIAGGSGNAAACMLAVDALCGYPLSLEQLLSIGASVGADVPFSLAMNARKNSHILKGLPGIEASRSSAWIGGIGEIVKPADPIPCSVILMNPGIPVSTREVYEAIDALGDHEVNDALFFNRMEEYTLQRYPEAAELKREMEAHLRAEHIVMSGSGPTMVAYYKDSATALEDSARASGADWMRDGWRIWCTESGGTVNGY